MLKEKLSPISPTSPPPGSTTAPRRSGRRNKNKENNGEPPPKRPLKLLWLLLCPAAVVEHDDVLDALHTAFAIYPEFPTPRISIIDVPQFAPLSLETAKRWSTIYWPCLYKNANPYGPSPPEVARIEGELFQGNSVHHWMRLAQRVAEEGRSHGMGETIGAVVVERSEEYGVRVVSVAADARRCGMPHHEREDPGNILGHAVLRAIGLVAQKRRIVDGKDGARSPPISEMGSPSWSPRSDSPNRKAAQDGSQDSSSSSHYSDGLPPPPTPDTPYLDMPMTFLEAHYFAPSTLMQRGYLCLNLEMYTTHEPCVMCSMALLHSRFGRVVFAREMAQTGGLVVDRLEPPEPDAINDSRYGLFWRSELNWKFLCWQYSGGQENKNEEEDEGDLATQLAHMSLQPAEERFKVADVENRMHA